MFLSIPQRLELPSQLEGSDKRGINKEKMVCGALFANISKLKLDTPRLALAMNWDLLKENKNTMHSATLHLKEIVDLTPWKWHRGVV